MSFIQSNLVEVKRIAGKGRGVFARQPIQEGQVIERVPMLIIPLEQLGDDPDILLNNYVFWWSRNKVALALGYGSLYNHSYQPNATYEDRPPATKVFRALRDIAIGEEITINYNGVPNDESSVGFDVR